jgi:ABC-type xylose transport system permease subunit
VFVWAITLAAGMAVRTLFGAGTEVSFVIVTAIVTAVGMLGWRAVALWLTRGERVAPTTGEDAAGR